MMKKHLRILATAAALAMIFTLLPGCGKSQPEQAGKTDTAKADTAGENYKFKILGNFEQLTDADKAWIDAVEKANNVKLEFEIPPTTGYTDRLQIMLATGEYPDVALFPDQNDKSFVGAVNNGIVIPVTQYLKNAPNLQKYTYEVSWDALKKKEGTADIYGIPRTSIMRNDGYIVRQDWTNHLGISIPADGALTLDQFTDMLRKITKNDPDKNGKNDTYGLAANADANGNLTPFVTKPFGMLGWQESKGKYKYMDLMYSRENDNYKRALEYSAMLVKEGLVDPNVAVNKSAQSDERYLQGITGVKNVFAGHVYLNNYVKMKDKFPGVQLTYLTGIKDDQGKVRGTQGQGFGVGFAGVFAVMKSAKDPQKIVNTFDWMLSDEGWPWTNNGIKDVAYKEDGGNIIAGATAHNLGRSMMRRKESPDFFISITFPKDWADKSKQWLTSAIGTFANTKDKGYRPAAADKPEFIDYKKKMDTTVSNIILGELPVSEYDKVLDGWYKAGGEEYVQQMNDYIKKLEGR